MNSAFTPPFAVGVSSVTPPYISHRKARTRPRLLRTARNAAAPIHSSPAPVCVWVEHSADVVIEDMNPVDCFDCYSDLEAMPKWSPWLKKVTVDKADPNISRWTIATRGIEISWKARNTKVKRGEIIRWVSETGLKNRGRVVFENVEQKDCRVTLAVEFDIPDMVAGAIDNDYVGKFVESTLSADLKRFRAVALHYRRRQKTTEEAKSTAMHTPSAES